MSQVETAPILGPYQVTREVRRDGRGILYEGEQLDGSPVFLQVIPPEVSSHENFIVRFELLKLLLPAITHRNLVRIVELAQYDNVCVLVKERSVAVEGLPPPTTLDQFNPGDTANKHRTLEALFDGIAQGLNALHLMRDSLHRTGITHRTLGPSDIYLTFDKGVVGGSVRPVPQLDGFAEPFLYYGDGPTAQLESRMEGGLFSREALHPATSRRGATGPEHMLFTLGALIHHSLTGLPVRGEFPTLTDVDPTLDGRWNQIADLCLKPVEEVGPTFEKIIALFAEMSAARTQLTPQERALKNVNIPDGMALVTFDGKVELGAADGPMSERPRFKARLEPFLMDTTPVTCAQFSEFTSAYEGSAYSRGGSHPATLISWQMANAYCRWRTEREQCEETPYRLPSEYEWEAACRGANGHQYPWGNEPVSSRMHCGKPKDQGAIPIQLMAPGRFGMYDMLGNVWEWTESVFKPHPFSQHEEKGYASTLYVVKGGCWFTPLSECRASVRAAYGRHEAHGNVGFRCVRAIAS